MPRRLPRLPLQGTGARLTRLELACSAHAACLQEYTTATTVTLVVNTVTGIILMLASFIMGSCSPSPSCPQLAPLDAPIAGLFDSTSPSNDVLRYFYYLLPPFSLGMALLQLFFHYIFQTLITSNGIGGMVRIPSLWNFSCRPQAERPSATRCQAQPQMPCFVPLNPPFPLSATQPVHRSAQQLIGSLAGLWLPR